MFSIITHPNFSIVIMGIVVGILGFFIQRTIFREIDKLKDCKVDKQIFLLREERNEKDIAEIKAIIEKIDAKLDALMVQVARINGSLS